MRYDLFAPKALRAALILRVGEKTPDGRPIVPGVRQVRRWVDGETPMPGWARREVAAMLGIPDTQKDAAPDIPERLEAVHRLVVAIAKATPGVDRELVAETEGAHLDADELRRGRQQSASQRRKVDRRPRDK